MPVSQTWIPATWPARMSGARAEQTSPVHHICLASVEIVPAQRRRTAAAALQAARRARHRQVSRKQRLRVSPDGLIWVRKAVCRHGDWCQ